MKENIVEIRFNVGPLEKDQELCGTYRFYTPKDVDKSFVIEVLKKSIAKLKITNEQMIVCVMDVFINNKQEYEAAVFGTSTILKSEIRKV